MADLKTTTRYVDGRSVHQHSLEVFDDTFGKFLALGQAMGVPNYQLLDSICRAAIDAYEREHGPLDSIEHRNKIRIPDSDMLSAIEATEKQRRGRKPRAKTE